MTGPRLVTRAALAMLALTASATVHAAGARHFKSGPIQVTADGRWVWVVNPDNDSVSRIDTVSDAVAEFPLPDSPARPLGLSVREDGSEVWVAGHDSDRVYVLDGVSGALRARIELPWGSGPYSVALSRDQTRALVTLHRSDGLAMIDVASRRLTDLLTPVYQAPLGIAWMEDGVSAWITHMGSDFDRVFFSRVDVSGPRPLVTSRIAAFPAPPQQSATLTDPDPRRNVAEGGYLFLRGHLAQVPSVSGRNQFWVPTEYHNVHDSVFTTPPSSTIQASIRHFNLPSRALLTDLIKDKVVLTATQVHGNTIAWAGYGWDAHIAGPVDIAFSADGVTSYILNEQSNNIVVVPVNTPAFKPAQATPPLLEIPVGAHPMGLAVSPTQEAAYVSNRLGSRSGLPAGRTVSVVDLAGSRELRQIVVSGEPYAPNLIRGARLFYTSADPRISPDAKTACATCHPGGEQDRRQWDLNHLPGLHGPRYTQTLLGIGRTFTPGQRDPVSGFGQLHLSGDRDEIQDFEHTFQGVQMGGTGFLGAAVNPELGPPNAGRNPDLDALADYVVSLEPLRRSPYRTPAGALSEAAARGATFFMGSDPGKNADAACGGCHNPQTGFVDFQFHNVGQYRSGAENELNVRTPPWQVNTLPLTGAWASPPYKGVTGFAGVPGLQTLTMIETLKDFSGRASHGTLAKLTRKQLSDLNQLVLSLDGNLAPAEVINARDTSPPYVTRAEPTSLLAIEVWFNESVDPASASNLANWTLWENGTPVAITVATFDPQNGDRVRLSVTLEGGCHTYVLVAGPILDLAASATGGVANPLDPGDPRNTRVLTIGNSLTITLGGSGYENITVPVHDAGIGLSLNTWTIDAPYLNPVAAKGLVRFDWQAAFAALTGLVGSPNILEASFSMEPEQGDSHPVEIRRVLLRWNDVHNGFIRTAPGGVSYNDHIAPGQKWNLLGAKKKSVGVDGTNVAHYNSVNDVSNVIDATAPMLAINERLVFAGPGVTAAFRFWFDNPAVDYGYMLELAPGALLETVFRRAEEEIGEHGPVLTLTYRVGAGPLPPPPGEVSGRGTAVPLLAAKRGAAVLLSFEDMSLRAESYNVYEGTIGRYYSHRGLGCNRLAALAAGRSEILYAPADAGASYFLVTAAGCAGEGPSDLDHPAALLDCPP